MIPYKNWETGEFRLVDSSNPSDVADATSKGFIPYVQPEGSRLPPPYEPGLVIYDFQIGNKNNPYA
jgi:hypothetical protein